MALSGGGAGDRRHGSEGGEGSQELLVKMRETCPWAVVLGGVGDERGERGGGEAAGAMEAKDRRGWEARHGGEKPPLSGPGRGG